MKSILTILVILFSNFNLTNAKIIYTDPTDNAGSVNTENNIIISFDEKILTRDITSKLIVSGSVSGIHKGGIIFTRDKQSLIFKPDQPFALNEKVNVELKNVKTTGMKNHNMSFSFYTQKAKLEVDALRYYDDEDPSFNRNVNSNNYSMLPAPALTVEISNNPTSGLLYTNSSQNILYPPHLIIADENGNPVFTREEPNGVVDFKRQPNGLMTYYSRTRRMFLSMDNDFNVNDSFYCGNGYITNIHDMQLLDNGNYLLTSYDPQPVDMSVIVPGGNPNAIVTGFIIQELDPDRNVVFQWRSWDHFQITDANHIDLTDSLIDYVHGNAVEPDDDGNIMMSCRHMSEITKISRATGDIIWRFGGINNEFTIFNDSVEFTYQHDIRRIANGNITMYDNGNFHTPNFSRAVEYQLDETNKTATLVWQYINDPVIYGNATGSVQRLSNGNTVICWGASPVGTFSEITPAGDIALQLTFEQGIRSYRGFFEILDVDLELKLAIEGFYDNSAGTMRRSDTVTAYVRNINSPFEIIDTSIAVLDSATLTAGFNFRNTPGGTYFITVKHRNSLETWSKAGGVIFTNGSTVSYDMTENSSKAFGSNLIQVDSSPDVFAVYSGDVNNDSYIEMGDVLYIYNDAINFITGYELSDITGDNISDVSDVLLAFNNSGMFVVAVTP
ncbi:MAG TPA: aryl-sulfate sulfotransferase [Ignavibacteria bacterium]|nr:aryl-sulfate sulfotransferase [Ignavibacteria bacterium]HMR40338.1 aryl-sulfate sulfotransferase [Ignavibacteria bacterium]